MYGTVDDAGLGCNANRAIDEGAFSALSALDAARGIVVVRVVLVVRS